MGKLLRVLTVFVLVLCLLTSVMVPVFAESEEGVQVSNTVIYHADGSRDEIEIVVFPGFKGTNQITGSKTNKHYSSSNELIWKVKLTGTFQYNGTTSICVNAYSTVNLYQSSWTVISENTTHSGNTAHSVVTLGKYIAGVLMTAGYSNLSLSCDKNGNLS